MARPLTIERDKWGTSALYNTGDQTFCCLGFYGLSLGITRQQMAPAPVPASCPAYREHPEAEWLLKGSLCDLLVQANDDLSVPSWEREEKIRAGFALAGVDVSFV